MLSKRLPPTLLSKVAFATFALGDSSYVKFNYAGKMLHNRLIQLGARPLLRRGDGDDQHQFGLYGDLFPWLRELAAKLSDLFPSCAGINIAEIPTETPPVRCHIGLEHTFQHMEPCIRFPGASGARLISNARITALDWSQDVRHVVLDITGSNLTYEPGDVVCTLCWL